MLGSECNNGDKDGCTCQVSSWVGNSSLFALCLVFGVAIIYFTALFHYPSYIDVRGGELYTVIANIIVRYKIPYLYGLKPRRNSEAKPRPCQVNRERMPNPVIAS